MHPPTELLFDVAEYLKREDRTCEVLLCAPSWCKKQCWEFSSLSDDRMKFPHNKLKPVAEDAPARIDEWPLTVFRIPARKTPRGERPPKRSAAVKAPGEGAPTEHENAAGKQSEGVVEAADEDVGLAPSPKAAARGGEDRLW